MALLSMIMLSFASPYAIAETNESMAIAEGIAGLVGVVPAE